MRTTAPPLLPIAAIAAFVLLASLAHAPAAMPPDNVIEAVDEAARSCKDMDGVPNTEAVLTVDDLNADGGEDWVVDYAKMKCDGSLNPMCGSGGCTLQIYFWDGATAWDLVYEELVQSYKFGKAGGKPMLTVTTSGDPCNKPSAETCTSTYRLEKDEVVPVK